MEYNDPLIGWIMERITPWQQWRDRTYKDDWGEFYRAWRGIYKEGDKQRQSERSKLIPPDIMQAIEVAVADIEEATFGRKNWIDVEDDIADDSPERGLVNQLLEDYELDKVQDAMSESFLLGAVYGTAIGKVVVKTKDFKFPGAEGIETKTEVRVCLDPVDPNTFIIDPAARTIEEALGCAQVMVRPRHGIIQKQKDGVYAKGDIGGFTDDGVDFEALGMERPSDTTGLAKITEWHGLVPKKLLRRKSGTVQVNESDEMVEAIVTFANDSVRLKAVENPFTMKDRSFIAYQHDKIPNSFYGRGVAEKGYHSHKALEAEMRGRIDAMAYSIHPMIAMDATKVPRGEKFTVYPGKTILTNGAPGESIQPVKFSPPDLSSFRATADYERMTQVATGSMDSATPVGQSPRNQTASGMSMILQGAIKRSKRTMRNAEQNFLDEWVRKSAWRYMQFAPDRYPMMDFKFKVHSTMGLLAREFEQGQITQLLNTTAPESPEYLMLIKSFYENSTLTTKDEMIALIDKRLQEAMNSQNIPPEVMQQQLQQIQAQIQAQANESIKQAEKKAQEAINQAKAHEARTNEMIREIQKKAQIDLSAEKVTNKAKEDVISLDFKRKEFELQQKVVEIENRYDEEINRIKEAIAQEEKREAEKAIAAAKDAENQDKEKQMSEKMEAVTVSVAPMEKLVAELKTANEAKERELQELKSQIEQHMMSMPTKNDLAAATEAKSEEVQKVVDALDKPRKVVRDGDGNITGVE